MPKTEEEKALKNKFATIKAASSKTAMVIYNLWNIVKIVGTKVAYFEALSPIFGIIYRLGYIINQGVNFTFNAGAKIAGVATRVLRSVFSFMAIGIAIAKLVSSTVPGPVAILSDIADVIDSIWSIGLSIKSFFSGSWKRHNDKIQLKRKEHTDLENSATPDAKAIHLKKSELIESENKIINKKAKLAGRVEGLIINVVFLVGSILLTFVPPLAPVGFGLLVAAGAYVLLDKFNLNPIKLIAKAIFGNPFENKTAEAAEVSTPSLFNRMTNWFGNLFKGNDVMEKANPIVAVPSISEMDSTAAVTSELKQNSIEKSGSTINKNTAKAKPPVSDGIAAHFKQALTQEEMPKKMMVTVKSGAMIDAPVSRSMSTIFSRALIDHSLTAQEKEKVISKDISTGKASNNLDMHHDIVAEEAAVMAGKMQQGSTIIQIK